MCSCALVQSVFKTLLKEGSENFWRRGHFLQQNYNKMLLYKLMDFPEVQLVERLIHVFLTLLSSRYLLFSRLRRIPQATNLIQVGKPSL